MGITDVTAGGAKPIRVETPQVSGPAPQRAPKTEVKTPPKATAPEPAPQAAASGGTGAAAADTAVNAAVARDVMQSEVQKEQTGVPVRAGENKDGGFSGERVSRPQGANRAGRLPAQDGQRVSGQREEKKEPAAQDSYFEKVMAEKAMESAEERLRALRHNVRFGYNDDIERYTITITDADDQKVVKEIPSEEIQKMIEHLHTMKGMMFDTEI